MNLFFKNILKRFRGRDYFYAVSFIAGEAAIATLAVDFERQEISIEHFEKHPFRSDDGEDILSVLKHFFRPFPRRKKVPVLIALDPRLTSTVQETISIARETPAEPIVDTDLDNRVAQGIWRFVNKERSVVAQKLKVHDLDLIMTNVFVRHVKLDGHRVVDPMGFSARHIDFLFATTFTPRAIAEKIRSIIPASQEIFLSEHGVSEAHLLQKAVDKEHMLLAEIFQNESHIFAVSGGTIQTIGNFPWGKTHMIESLAREFMVSPEIGEALYEAYIKRQASKQMLTRMEKILQTSSHELETHLATLAQSHTAEAIYLYASFSLPNFLTSSRLKLRRGTIRMMPIPASLHGEEFGFTVQAKEGISLTEAFHPLSAFFEFYFIPHGDKMNAIARRHARWLLSA